MSLGPPGTKSGPLRQPSSSPVRACCTSLLRQRPSAAQRRLDQSNQTRMGRLSGAQRSDEHGLHSEPVRPQHICEHLIADGAGRARIRSHHGHSPLKGDGQRFPCTRDHRQPEILSDLSHSPPTRRIADETRPHPLFVSSLHPPAYRRTDMGVVPIDQRVVQVQYQAPHPMCPERIQVYLPDRPDEDAGRQ
jgi:hypothetical protein